MDQNKKIKNLNDNLDEVIDKSLESESQEDKNKNENNENKNENYKNENPKNKKAVAIPKKMRMKKR